MADTTAHSDASLPELLAARARSSSDLRLTLDVAVGLAAGAVAVWWHPTGWIVALSAALCFAAFGAWGLADRALRARHATIELIPTPHRLPDGALVALRVIDQAIQAFGGAGMCEDFGLARMYANTRIVRITDGPDEVHCRQIAQLELAKHVNKTDADVKAYS